MKEQGNMIVRYQLINFFCIPSIKQRSTRCRKISDYLKKMTIWMTWLQIEITLLKTALRILSIKYV